MMAGNKNTGIQKNLTKTYTQRDWYSPIRPGRTPAGSAFKGWATQRSRKDVKEPPELTGIVKGTGKGSGDIKKCSDPRRG